MLAKAFSAIKLSTLNQLLQSASPEIREASMRILSERTLQNATVWKILRRDLASKNFEARDRALAILIEFLPALLRPAMITINTEHSPFFQTATYASVVKCLCNMLPAAREAENMRIHHSSSEADALWLMQKLVEHDILQALKAGLVRKWLSQYPINAKSPEKERKIVIRDLIKACEYNDDYERLLCCVLHDTNDHQEARSEMEKYGIGDPGYVSTGRAYSNADAWAARRYHPSSSYVRLNDDVGIDTDEEVPWEVAGEPGPELVEDFIGVSRRREESDEEMALRRRRREAMVFAENGRPIRREDIIEREEVIADEEVEEELEQLIEEMEAEMGPDADADAEDEDEGWVGWLSRVRPDGSLRARTRPSSEDRVDRVMALEMGPDDEDDEEYPPLTQEVVNERHGRDMTISLLPREPGPRRRRSYLPD